MAEKWLIFRHSRCKQSTGHTKVKISLNQRWHERYRSEWPSLQRVNRFLNLPYSHPLYLLSLCLSDFSLCCLGLFSVISYTLPFYSPLLFLYIDRKRLKKDLSFYLFHLLFSYWVFLPVEIFMAILVMDLAPTPTNAKQFKQTEVMSPTCHLHHNLM